jgi:simple sugar transport system ATP-binding protein
MMVGREIDLTVDKAPAKPGAPVLTMSSVTMTDDFGRDLLDDINLEVRAGEIVGVAGIQGNGQTELIEAITGLLPIARGSIKLKDVDITGFKPRQIHRDGVAHVPEDRNEMGMIGSFTVAENLVLDSYYSQPY